MWMRLHLALPYGLRGWLFARNAAMSHVVLLGDSIFDNAAYVGPRGTPVIAWLRQELPAGWRATLGAIDGSTTHDIPEQLRDLPAKASHLVVSIGGNNALFNKNVLSESARSAAA